MVNSLLPDDAKVKITIHDIKLGSNLTTNKTIRFTIKSFFYRKVGSTQSRSSAPNEPPDVYIQKVART